MLIKYTYDSKSQTLNSNITHVPPVPDYQHDFTPKLVVVSRLHDTVAEFRTGVKFSFPLTLAMTTLNPSKVVF